ncbi:MAG: NUDIX domain-containing protein [Lentisphaerae bacterium]|nr:NUDIX domain-containing protein [Lentisphaerota bacterium]
MSDLKQPGRSALPEVAAVVLVDARKRILLQHRTSDAPHFPGFWAFFGGGVEPGESLTAAARREVQEELGLKLRYPHFFQEYLLKEYGAWFRLHLFVNNFFADKGQLRLKEGQNWGWFNAAGLVRLKTIPDDLCILLDVARYLGWNARACGLLARKIDSQEHRVYRRWQSPHGVKEQP